MWVEHLIEEVEFDGTFAEFLEFLRTDPQFYFEDPDELYREYLATSKRIDPELEAMTHALSIATFRFVPADLRKRARTRRVAEYLDGHDQVVSVAYAGLPDSPWFERAERYLVELLARAMRNGGGTVDILFLFNALGC